jgi:hypothetical protein
MGGKILKPCGDLCELHIILEGRLCSVCNPTGVIQKLKIQTGGWGREVTALKVATLSCLEYSHFHLFLPLKKHLAGQKFYEDEEVKNEVTTCLHALALVFYDIRIQKLTPTLNKCLNKGVDCVENYLKVVLRVFSLDFVNIFKKYYCVCVFTFWMSYILVVKYPQKGKFYGTLVM